VEQLTKEGFCSPLNAAFIGERSLPEAATPHSNIQAVLLNKELASCAMRDIIGPKTRSGE
jgi:hypothetical protein